jgi:glutathione S-transferase
VKPKLYLFPGSHPCECAEAGFRLKRISYTRVNLLPVFHKLVVRAHFDGTTVPALELDGERIVGSRAILRRLEQIEPEPRLIPEDPGLRARVEEIEEWGDDEFQDLVRRIAWAGLSRDADAMMSYAADAKLSLPRPLLRRAAEPVAAFASRFNGADDDERSRADVCSLPGHFDRIESWMDEGVIGGDSPNVADLQLGSAIRLLGTFEDLHPLLAGRACVRLGENGFEPAVGRIPAGTLPAGWVAEAQSAA